MYNVRSRQPRRIIIARRVDNEKGYETVKLEAVDYLDIKPDSPILGIFKHKTQQRNFSMRLPNTQLCPKLLRLQNSGSYASRITLDNANGRAWEKKM